MGTHLGAVGFGRDPARLADQLAQLMSSAELVGMTDGERLRVYRHLDPSGATVTVTLEDSRVTCMTPGIAPGRVISATSAALLDDDCPYERPLEVSADVGDLEIPLAVTIDDLAISEPALTRGRDLKLALGAIAERIAVFPDETAYRASGTPMAVESLIPSGLFAPGPGREAEHRPSSRMLMSGILTASERRAHELLGHAFVHARVRSMQGEWEIAIDPSDLADDGLPQPGAIVSGTFWLSGHLAA